MQKIYTLIVFGLIFSAVSSYAQYTNIRVDGPPSIDPNEVAIAINPVNPNELAAGAPLAVARKALGGRGRLTDRRGPILDRWGHPGGGRGGRFGEPAPPGTAAHRREHGRAAADGGRGDRRPRRGGGGER